MKNRSPLRPLGGVALVALAAALLLVPQASAAQKVPSLVSTPQYKALVKYVAKLRERGETPTTESRKSIFESTLTDRHRAAVNKSTALFKRARRAAKSQTRSGFKADSRVVRKAEAKALAALRAEYIGRFQRAEDDYHVSLARIEDAADEDNARLGKRIQRLRKAKAKADGALAKDRYQNRIEAAKEDIAENLRDVREARKRLRANFIDQREAIRVAKAKDTATVEDAGDKKVEQLKRRWDRTYSRKLGRIQNKRSNQVSNLEDKLNAGRYYIALMPSDA